jgi:hypothetical protein
MPRVIPGQPDGPMVALASGRATNIGPPTRQSIVKAAVEGRLPRGFGLKRLVDLPMAWPD